MTVLTDNYLLAVVTHRAPKAKRVSKQGLQAMADDAKNKGAEFSAAKELGTAFVELYSEGSIKSVMAQYTAFNTYHQSITCEYLGGRGAPRLLNIKKQKEHSDRFHANLIEWEKARDAWITEYETERALARKRLGDYFQDSDYPPADSIRDHWSFECQYLPIGDSSGFEMGDFAEDQRKQLQAQLDNAVTRAASQATENYKQRLSAELAHISKQLRDGKRLHSSMIDKLRTLADADLNASGDKELSAAVKQADDVATAAEHAIKSKDDNVRKQAASKANIMKDAIDAITGSK